MLIDATGRTSFTLLEGTDDKFEIDWPTVAFPVGLWGVKVYDALRALRDAATRTAPQTVPVFDGVILGWIYTAIEAQALRDANAKMRDVVEDLEKRVRALEHDLRNVEAVQQAQRDTRATAKKSHDGDGDPEDA